MTMDRDAEDAGGTVAAAAGVGTVVAWGRELSASTSPAAAMVTAAPMASSGSPPRPGRALTAFAVMPVLTGSASEGIGVRSFGSSGAF
jgi:hypothetical protein